MDHAAGGQDKKVIGLHISLSELLAILSNDCAVWF